MSSVSQAWGDLRSACASSNRYAVIQALAAMPDAQIMAATAYVHREGVFAPGAEDEQVPVLGMSDEELEEAGFVILSIEDLNNHRMESWSYPGDYLLEMYWPGVIWVSQDAVAFVLLMERNTGWVARRLF